MQDVVFFIADHWILSVIWLFLLMIITVLIIKDFFSKFKIINNVQAINLINKNCAIVIDTRPLKFFEKGHIVNSIHLPLKDILLGNLKKIELYKLSPIILIFNTSNKYNACIKEFFKYGFNNIFILKNGINYWNSDHLPLVIKNK